jgi:hypothetical protein
VERKAEAEDLEKWLKSHRANCVKCGAGKGRIRCERYKEVAGRLAAVKRDIKTWFDPGEDQGSLFDEPQPGKES